MKNADAESCHVVWCGMLSYGKCGMGNNPETCETARGVKQHTFDDLNDSNTGGQYALRGEHPVPAETTLTDKRAVFFEEVRNA